MVAKLTPALRASAYCEASLPCASAQYCVCRTMLAGRDIPLQIVKSRTDLAGVKQVNLALEVELQFVFIQAEYVKSLA